MKITKKIISYFVVLDLLLLSLFGNLWFIFNNEHSLGELQKQRYESRLLAEELRRSSDDLTRMARTYVVTGDQKFLEYFKQISAIRDGVAPRPENYENIYWDFISAQKDWQSKPGQKISIIERMKALHFSERELDLLSEAKELSDELSKMEVQAFNALQGLFLADDGTYSVKKNPDPELAREIVFGKAYHLAKAGIMEKVDRFFDLLNSRTEKETQNVAELQKGFLIAVQILSLILIGMGIFGFLLFKTDIVKPLNQLSEWVKHMQNGQYNFDAGECRKDEIGVLTQTFVKMAGQVSNYILSLEQASKTDPLTQIKNRIALDNALVNEMYKFERYGTPCSVIMLDVDHFKDVNDRYGHLAGDKVLREITHVLTTMTRMSDILGRWGGDEFLLICPDTDLKSAKVLAELIRKHIANHDFSKAGHVTVSLGVSVFEKGGSAEEAIKNGDEFLCKAKSEGRNRVG